MNIQEPRDATAAHPIRRRSSLPRGKRRLFLLATVLAIAVGQELLFRGLFPMPEVSGFNRVRYQMMAGTHPDLWTIVRRGLVYDRLLFESEPDGFSEVHNLNLYGFRTPDFRIEPPRDRRRILLLGDSLTEGQGAPDSGTIGAAWQRLLDSDGIKAEVINLGVVAATLTHLTQLARDAVPLLRPSDVVLVLYANDLPAPPFPSELAGPAPSFVPRDTPWFVPRLAELMVRVARGEPVHRRWFHRPIPFFPAYTNPASPWTNGSAPPAGLDPELFRAMRAGRINPWLYEQAKAIPGLLAHDFSRGGLPTAYLGRIDEICREARANLLIVFVPFYGVTSPRYSPFLKKFGMDPAIAEEMAANPTYRRQNRILRDLCEGMKLRLADTTEAIVRAETAGTPQFWGYDSHPRPVGYATIAGEIHRSWKASSKPRGLTAPINSAGPAIPSSDLVKRPEVSPKG